MAEARPPPDTRSVPVIASSPQPPRVSVIVPVFNGATYLKATLDALSAQSCSALEIIVVDDGSTDASREVVQSHRDHRVRLVRQENRGLAHALNRGLNEARAEYVARNDHDDLSMPSRLERQMAVLDSRPDALAVFARWTKFGGRRTWHNVEHSGRLTRGEIRESEPHRDGCLLASTMCARATALRAIGGFRQDYYPSDDWDLQLRLSAAGAVLITEEPLVAYRFHFRASTYRLFLLDQDKTRWAEDSCARRANGDPELPFEAFVELSRQHKLKRLAMHLTDRSRLHMRLAGQHYLDGRDGTAMIHAAVAACLNPMAVGQRAARFFR